jgi:DNA repair exonuclease SbcCD ATPase subunit
MAIEDQTDDKDKEDKQNADQISSATHPDGKGSKKAVNKNKDALNPVNSYRNELERIQEYDVGFKSIFEATQINDINTLIEQFEKAENNNYSLLKYAESLSSDIKELDEEVKQVETEIEKYDEDGGEMVESKRANNLKINEELEKTEKETKEYESQYKDTVKTINQLKIGIKSIFDRIGCNNESVQEQIGTHGVTESNMMQYLGIIEQRTNEVSLND